jgi:hypothetical protein
MDYGTHIKALLEEWQKLTQAESDAIASGQWQALLGAQQAKQSLREQIDELLREAPSPANSHPSSVNNQTVGRKSPIAGAPNHLISRLLEQERANQQALAEKRRLAHHAFAQSENSLRHLRQLNRAYGEQVGNQWQSYC